MQLVYVDRTHSCLLLWAGRGAGPVVTWRWDGTTWSRSPDVPLNQTEYFQGVASDPTNGQALLISLLGRGPDLPPTETHTWTWDGHAWTLRHPRQQFPVDASAPVLASVGAGLPDRLGRGIVAVFSHGNGLSQTSQTWFWDGATWTQRAVGPTTPYVPIDATMAADATTHAVVLIGLGDVVGGGNGSTWLWDGSAWHQAGPAPLIGNGATSLLADSESAHAIVFGDRTPDSRSNTFDVLWTFDGTGWVRGRPG